MHRLPRALRLRQQIHIRPRLSRPIQRRTLWRSSGKTTEDPTRVQAVRFVKPPTWTLRRIATFGLYGGAVYAYLHLVWRYLDIEIEFDDEMDEKNEDEAGDLDDEDYFAQEDSTFIPLTWATKMPRTFYRGSDSEWQEFIKVAKDKERHRKIQQELVQIVFTGSVQHPGINRQLGKDAKIGKYWLDITFPDGPPQEFERSGIEIGDGYIAWSQQKVSPENHWRLMRALWPKAAFDSLWATTKVLSGIQYRRVKQALGWEDKDPFSPEERYRNALELLQKQQQKNGVGNAQTEPGSNSGAVVNGATSDAQNSRPLSGDSKKLPWQIQVPLPTSSSSANSMDVPIAMHVFSSTLSKQWNPKKLEPPKGTFVVQGLVEVRGSLGRMLFDVQSCYDPKLGKYVTVNAGVRNFKRWNQAPRGGP